MEFNATFLVAIISFLVFMKIMNAIFYVPLTTLIEERENIVNKNFEDARQANIEVENLIKNKEEQLAQAAKDSRQILIDKTNEANSNYHNKINEAKTNSTQRVIELKNELTKSEIEAKEILNSHVDLLAQSIVDKVLNGGTNGWILGFNSQKQHL